MSPIALHDVGFEPSTTLDEQIVLSNEQSEKEGIVVNTTALSGSLPESEVASPATPTTDGTPTINVKAEKQVDDVSAVQPALVNFEEPAILEHISAPAVQAPMVQAPAHLPASTRLQKMLHETDELIVCPGVYDGLSARTAIEVGFSGLYMTGAGTSASRLGMADLGLATLSDMRAHAEMICNLKPHGPPVIADMDTGYGGSMMVYRSVCEYIRAGVAGFHLEDQVLTKRCGHLKGKAVVPREEYYMRIRAAKLAKDHMGSDIVLIARTDALQQLGYDECIARLKVARELGADVGLLEGFTSKSQAHDCVKQFPGWPLLLNSVENGASPLITVDEARSMGFRIMIFSFASIAPAYQAIRATFLKLKKEGIIGTKGEITPRKIFEVCGLDDLMDQDVCAGGSLFAAGV